MTSHVIFIFTKLHTINGKQIHKAEEKLLILSQKRQNLFKHQEYNELQQKTRACKDIFQSHGLSFTEWITTCQTTEISPIWQIK